jgi:hypothetical protein
MVTAFSQWGVDCDYPIVSWCSSSEPPRFSRVELVTSKEHPCRLCSDQTSPAKKHWKSTGHHRRQNRAHRHCTIFQLLSGALSVDRLASSSFSPRRRWGGAEPEPGTVAAVRPVQEGYKQHAFAKSRTSPAQLWTEDFARRLPAGGGVRRRETPEDEQSHRGEQRTKQGETLHKFRQTRGLCANIWIAITNSDPN